MIPGRIVAAVLAVIVLPANAQGKEDILNRAGTAIFAQSATKATLTASNSHNVTLLPSLIAEALENNPEIQAAYQEREAAQQRVSPAEALDDPMLEAGVINAPLASLTPTGSRVASRDAAAGKKSLTCSTFRSALRFVEPT